ncbi:hypothetical protein AVEN_57945-1 [Araneus ventricosus]|uniref:Uncharacterized protein n=1 Tax=Araneus ventricosus TaxID=182803 RepID=A0A4Y2UK51_ARAVE|nr:hypothetical protein AVEN_57945-1 [Araneus ventricosus]
MTGGVVVWPCLRDVTWLTMTRRRLISTTAQAVTSYSLTMTVTSPGSTMWTSPDLMTVTSPDLMTMTLAASPDLTMTVTSPDCNHDRDVT